MKDYIKNTDNLNKIYNMISNYVINNKNNIK